MMADLAADEELLVQIEGIEIMTEYLSCIKRAEVEKDFIPNFEKMLKVTQDAAINDEIRARMAKLVGKAIDKLSLHQLTASLEQQSMEYFKAMIKDKDNEVRKWAAYNLPCFN